jgi:type II secretory pathway component GspD/PulD (secretin)
MLQIIRSLLTEYGSAIADPRTNSLIVTEIPQRMTMIEETIAKLDVKPTQILIEAEVLEVTLDTLRRLGVEYGTSTGQIGSYLGPKRALFFPFNASQLQGATESHTLGTLSLADASILFKLLATEKDVKFLARPRLLTLSNEVAEIRIVADAATGVTSTSQATTGTVIEDVERNTVGTILRVTPMVNEDRYITMVIEPEVSRVIQSSSFSNFLDPNRRAARTTVMVPDNGTAMIAGLISTEDTLSARRIPLLGDLPILGLPFKRTDTERKNTEIILFITPHIIREEAPLTLALDREQTPLSPQERRVLEFPHEKVLRRRAWNETIENILR